MVQIEADPAKNLLTIVFAGKVTEVEMEGHMERVGAQVKRLRHGFQMLTDLSGLESMELGSTPYLTRAMDLAGEAGVSKIVRVIPDPRKDIGLTIMSRFHYPRKVQIVTCDSIDEAMQALGGML